MLEANAITSKGSFLGIAKASGQRIAKCDAMSNQAESPAIASIWGLTVSALVRFPNPLPKADCTCTDKPALKVSHKYKYTNRNTLIQIHK